VQSLKAELAATKAQGSSGLLVNQESQADMTPPSGDVSEEAEEESQESLLVNQVNQVNQNDIKAFDETFDNLVRGRYDVLIWKLRKKLNWTRERFDAIVKHLRDEGRYQLQAAEKDKMTKAQIAAGFWDENGNEYQAILRLPAAASAPMGEPEPEPEALAVLAPESEAPKPQNQKGRGKTAEAVGATEATIEETKKQRRGPGRPRKPRNEDTTTKLVK
jgi:hypothetical protein